MEFATADQFSRLLYHMSEVPASTWMWGALAILIFLPFIVTLFLSLVMHVPVITWLTLKATARGVSYGLCKTTAYYRNGAPFPKVIGQLADAFTLYPIQFFFNEAMGTLTVSSETLAAGTMTWRGVFKWYDNPIDPPHKGNWAKWVKENEERRARHKAMVEEHGPDYDV